MFVRAQRARVAVVVAAEPQLGAGGLGLLTTIAAVGAVVAALSRRSLWRRRLWRPRLAGGHRFGRPA